MTGNSIAALKQPMMDISAFNRRLSQQLLEFAWGEWAQMGPARNTPQTEPVGGGS
jgi:hypothetical protein